MLDKLKDYPALAAKTEKDLGSMTMRLMHGCLGIQTEVGEIAETVQLYIFSSEDTLDKDNVVEEVGDVLWYLAILANSLQLDFDVEEKSVGRLPVAVLSGELTILSGRIGDVIKRYAIYNKDIDLTLIQQLLLDTLRVLSSLVLHSESTLLEAAAQNITKLQKRYPEKYSNQAALARADKNVTVNINDVAEGALIVGHAKTIILK